MYYNHNLRTNLSEWKNRLYRAIPDQFANQLKYVLGNFESNSILKGLLQDAIQLHPYDDSQLEQIFANRHGSLKEMFENEVDQASFCYLFLKFFIKKVEGVKKIAINPISRRSASH